MTDPLALATEAGAMTEPEPRPTTEPEAATLFLAAVEDVAAVGVVQSIVVGVADAEAALARLEAAA